jgi:uncharacterized integral membrane protein
MIRKLVTALILVPLAIVFVSLAVANRQLVAVSFDPFDDAHPAFSVSLPLFALILILLIGGVVLGGTASWLRQGKWRGRARRLEAEARKLRQENERLQRRAGVPDRPPSGLPVVDAPRLTIPPPA